MDDVFILKAADDVNDGIHLADVGKKLVAQSFTLGRALDKTCDIDKFEDSRGEFLRVVHFSKLV